MSTYEILTPKLHARRYDWCNNYQFWCPGCKEPHGFRTDLSATALASKPPIPKWTFNGDINKPTFTPSLRYPSKPIICHLNVTDGKIIYHADSQHVLAGKTVDMEDIEDEPIH